MMVRLLKIPGNLVLQSSSIDDDGDDYDEEDDARLRKMMQGFCTLMMMMMVRLLKIPGKLVLQSSSSSSSHAANFGISMRMEADSILNAFKILKISYLPHRQRKLEYKMHSLKPP
jgi:hypothetical protein